MLVHCIAGVSRSAAVVAAYLLRCGVATSGYLANAGAATAPVFPVAANAASANVDIPVGDWKGGPAAPLLLPFPCSPATPMVDTPDAVAQISAVMDEIRLRRPVAAPNSSFLKV